MAVIHAGPASLSTLRFLDRWQQARAANEPRQNLKEKSARKTSSSSMRERTSSWWRRKTQHRQLSTGSVRGGPPQYGNFWGEFFASYCFWKKLISGAKSRGKDVKRTSYRNPRTKRNNAGNYHTKTPASSFFEEWEGTKIAEDESKKT
ncbi:hypothetical protein RvY_12543 [Ramazzottius varieornatus]|uniref:Uncharacterized protein n=1 Tax=Ramazzottius varieornatus TaxID=947166 RepID=A0A1D1VJW8_RAMVA|nr:hypothetical protein RvY_12543 [Ramazzottius varieornatus]